MESEQLVKHAPTDHTCKKAKVAPHETRAFAWLLVAAEVQCFDDEKKNGYEDSIDNQKENTRGGGIAEKQKRSDEERKGKNKVEDVDKNAGKLLPFRILRSVRVGGHHANRLLKTPAGRPTDWGLCWKG